MDKTQFILSIATNIVAAVIIWSWKRLVRNAKSLLVTGTIKAKVSATLSAKATPIIASSLLLVFDLLLLLRLIIGQSVFTRSQILFACIAALVSAYWTKQLINFSGFGIVRQLRRAEGRLEVLAEQQTRDRERLNALGPRRLTEEQVTSLIEGLRRAENRNIEIVQRDDPEARDFSMQLADVFRRAGWAVVISRFSLVPRGFEPERGLILGAPESPPTEAILEAFSATRLPLEFRRRDAGQPTTLVVGVRPPIP